MLHKWLHTYLLYENKYYSGLKTQIQATLNEIIR